MKRLGPLSPLCHAAALAAAALFACTWTPWIPGERSWNPPVVVDPAKLAERLPLPTTYVDELDCYAQRCERRFRLVVEEPGQLTVRVLPELASQDAQGRLVLESPGGVLAQSASGRGPHPDVVVLAVREPVNPGTYFVLLQSLGGPMPFELTAVHSPGEGPASQPSAAAVREEVPPPAGPPPRLAKVKLPGQAGAGYDPEVSFAGLRTFQFPRATLPGETPPAGTPLEQPLDRQIRRFLADDLERKGFRQATGKEPADLLVDFSRGAVTRDLYHPFAYVYGWYDVVVFQGPYLGGEVDTRATLTVDILEARSQRLAWHAYTTKGVGPGITYGEETTRLVREAVHELLAPFPPR